MSNLNIQLIRMQLQDITGQTFTQLRGVEFEETKKVLRGEVEAVLSSMDILRTYLKVPSDREFENAANEVLKLMIMRMLETKDLPLFYAVELITSSRIHSLDNPTAIHSRLIDIAYTVDSHTLSFWQRAKIAFGNRTTGFVNMVQTIHPELLKQPKPMVTYKQPVGN